MKKDQNFLAQQLETKLLIQNYEVSDPQGAMVKDSYRGGADSSGGASAPRRIKSVHFGMQSPHEMEQCAQIKVSGDLLESRALI